MAAHHSLAHSRTAESETRKTNSFKSLGALALMLRREEARSGRARGRHLLSEKGPQSER